MNIFEKLAKITAELPTIAKNLTVSTGKNQSYKAVGEGDVLRAVKSLEAKYGVYSYPCSREIVEACVLTKKKAFKDELTETTQQFMRVKTTYRFVNVEKPDELIEIDTYGDGVDSQDKAPGKAMTYADKYALLKAYKIETGDDPDQWGSEELGKNNAPINSAPSVAQLAALKKVNRSIVHVAKANGIDEKAVTSQHVADYLAKVAEYQKQKEAEQAKLDEQLNAEAYATFAGDSDE